MRFATLEHCLLKASRYNSITLQFSCLISFIAMRLSLLLLLLPFLSLLPALNPITNMSVIKGGQGFCSKELALGCFFIRTLIPFPGSGGWLERERL